MVLFILCIPVALLCGLLWGVAIEKHRAAKRRGKVIDGLLHRSYQPDEPKRRSF